MTAMSAMPGMMPGAMPGMGQPGQPQDFNKLFLAEKENVMITPHNWELDTIEEKLLKKYGKSFKSTTKKPLISVKAPTNKVKPIVNNKNTKRR